MFGRKSVGSLEAFSFLKVVDHVTNCPSRPKRLKRVRLKKGGGNEFYTKYQIGLIRVSTNRLIEGLTFTLRRASSNSKERKDMLCYTFKMEDVHTIN